ncbi:hypothetical protein BTHI11S_01251 [Bosea thiooxidans]
MHDRDLRRPRPDLLRDTQAEIGTVDRQQEIGLEGHDATRRVLHPPQQQRQAGDDRAEAHHRDIGLRKERHEPGLGQTVIADAAQFQRPLAEPVAQCCKEAQREAVARNFPR